MPTEFWYPESGATHDLPSDAWTNSGGANKNASTRTGGGRTATQTHDADSSFIRSNSTNTAQSINLDMPGPIASLPGGFTFTALMRARTESGTGIRTVRFTKSGGGTSSSLIHNISSSATSYYNTSAVDVSNGTNFSPWGSAWTPAMLNGYVLMSRPYGNANVGQRITSLWGQLEYEPPQGGFIFILQLAGLSALPHIGTLLDIGQFRTYLSWRETNTKRGTILRPDEACTAWRELREYRFPTFFIPGQGLVAV